MRRMMIALFALTLAVAACGGNDETTGSNGGTDGSTQATTGSTAAPTTTTEAAPDMKPGVAALIAFQGQYEGMWNNTTFGSSGAFKITVSEVNTTANFALIAVDVDGNAFGGEDPPGGTAEIDFGPDPAQILGSIIRSAGDDITTIEFQDERHWTVSATPAGLGGGVITVEVAVDDDGFEGTYEITGPDGTPFADGTFSADKVAG